MRFLGNFAYKFAKCNQGVEIHQIKEFYYLLIKNEQNEIKTKNVSDYNDLGISLRRIISCQCC